MYMPLLVSWNTDTLKKTNDELLQAPLPDPAQEATEAPAATDASAEAAGNEASADAAPETENQGIHYYSDYKFGILQL